MLLGGSREAARLLFGVSACLMIIGLGSERRIGAKGEGSLLGSW